MREQYPFFREEDERTRAIIGQDAAEADLNGDYQKPYAILTQKRLYCKNETGNYIVDSTSVQMGKQGKSTRSPLILVSILLLVVSLVLQLLSGFPWTWVYLSKAQQAVDNQEPIKQLQAELLNTPSPLDETAETNFQQYLRQYSDTQLEEIRTACGLDNLPAGEELEFLQGAEESLELLQSSDSNQLDDPSLLSEEALKHSIFDLIWKYRECMDELLVIPITYHLYYHSYDYSEPYGTPGGLPMSWAVVGAPEGTADLFAQYCMQIEQNGGPENCDYGPLDNIEQQLIEMLSYQDDLSTYLHVYLGACLYELDGSYQQNSWLDMCHITLRGYVETPPLQFDHLNTVAVITHFYPADMLASEQLNGYENEVTKLFWRLLAALYFEGEGEQTSPQEFFKLFQLVGEWMDRTGDTQLEALNMELGLTELAVPPEGEDATTGAITQEQLQAISSYSLYEREAFLLPLSRLSGDDVAVLRARADKEEQINQLQSPGRDQNIQPVADVLGQGGSAAAQLKMSALLPCLAGCLSLLGMVALLLLYALKLEKLASLAGLLAGALIVVISLPNVVGIATGELNASMLMSPIIGMGQELSRTSQFAALVVGVGIVATSAVGVLRALKSAQVPVFQLITPMGVFTFRERDYSKEERTAFANALATGKGGN